MNKKDFNSISLKARYRINIMEKKSDLFQNLNDEKINNIFEKKYFQKYSKNLDENKSVKYNYYKKNDIISKALLKKNIHQLLNNEKLTAFKVHSILSKFENNSKNLHSSKSVCHSLILKNNSYEKNKTIDKNIFIKLFV